VPGTYALLLQLESGANVTVGRLGTMFFPAGYYVYVGSALGPGGLAARLQRHLRAKKRLFWHIDHLLTQACIVTWLVDDSGRRLECAWARALVSTLGVQVAVPRFGASDCRCATHLAYVGASAEPSWDRWQSSLAELGESIRRAEPGATAQNIVWT